MSMFEENRGKTRLVCGESMTRQASKDECNINKIMAKFQRTGAVTHFTKRSPEYGFVPATDFAGSLEVVKKAQDMFNELPSSVRKRFNNDPGHFLAFVGDPANKAEMEALGLTAAKPPIVAAAAAGDPAKPV